MPVEYAFGTLPIDFSPELKVLLVKHTKGHWGFPKGHANPKESPLQTAHRELFEETGLSITKVLQDDPITETYTYRHPNGELRFKTVEYFLVTTNSIKPKIQEEEVSEVRWCTPEQAEKLLTFPESKKLLQKALDTIAILHTQQ